MDALNTLGYVDCPLVFSKHNEDYSIHRVRFSHNSEFEFRIFDEFRLKPKSVLNEMNSMRDQFLDSDFMPIIFHDREVQKKVAKIMEKLKEKASDEYEKEL